MPGVCGEESKRVEPDPRVERLTFEEAELTIGEVTPGGTPLLHNGAIAIQVATNRTPQHIVPDGETDTGAMRPDSPAHR